MPRGDRTGPQAMGSRTGRAAGYCAGFETPGYASSGRGAGFGAGFGSARGLRRFGFGGGGYGRRCQFYATGQPGWFRYGAYAPPAYGYPTAPAAPDPEVEKQALEAQVNTLRAELNALEKRLNEVKGDTEAD